MDHFSYLMDRQHRFLLIGIILLVMVVVFTLSEETLERYRIVCRSEEPKRFWWDVVLYFLAGLFFIGLYIAQNSN